MTEITENEIELFAVELLKKQAFKYTYTTNIALNINKFRRKSHEYR